MYCNLQFI